MSSPGYCEYCGKELPNRAPGGLCPNCLLGLAEAELEAVQGGVRHPDFEARGSALEAKRFANYVLLEKIGEGGMGVVYRARQINLGRIVAVKLLPFGQFSREEVVRRFRAEAAAAASLQHPNIVAIHEVGEHEGQQFFSMDLITGHTLAELVRDQPLPAKRAATYLKTIAEAVHYAHQHGILHRDLKPSNVIIDASDQPRVTDFGLAKRLAQTADHGPRTTDLTLSGQVLGSPNFMSPEQAGGRANAIGPASDVYSLGALLYHLLTRQPPFQAETLTTLLKQVAEAEPVRPRLLNPNTPRDLETICLKCLEKEPARRYENAQALADELARFLEDAPIQARPISAGAKAWKWCRRRPAVASMAGGLALSMALGLAGVLWQWHRASETARQKAAGEYAADMHGAQLAIDDDNRALAISLLDHYRPRPNSASHITHSGTDLRGWEWRYLWQLCKGDESIQLHRYSGAVKALATSKDGVVLAVATSDAVALWDVANRQPLTRLPAGPPSTLAFSPTESLLAVGTWGSAGEPLAELWDLSSDNATMRQALSAGNRSLAFSPDGRRLAALDEGGKVTIVDCASGHIVRELPMKPFRYGGAGALVFAPDADHLAIGLEYGALRLLDVRTGTLTPFETGTDACVSALAFSSATRLLAAGFGYGEGSICLWDIDASALVGHPPPRGTTLGDAANCVAVLPSATE